MSDCKTTSSNLDHAAIMAESTDNPPKGVTAERWTHHLQSRHRDGINRHWVQPVRIGRPSSKVKSNDNSNTDLDLDLDLELNLTRRLYYRDTQYRHTNNLLHSLPAPHYPLFSFKDSALYLNHGPDEWEISHDAPDTVYSEWFPHRAREQDFRHESYFAKPMRFWPPVETVEEVVKFHKALCGKLRGLELETEMEMETVGEGEGEGKGSSGGDVTGQWKFRLRPTFSKVLIVVEEGWEEQGVLLVCMDEGTAEVLGANKAVENGGAGASAGAVQRYEVTDGSDMSGMPVFRCSLRRAMKLLISQDPERARRRREYCLLTNEVYGSEEEDDEEGES